MGGLVALGTTTQFADTLTRPALAQVPPTEPPSWLRDDHFLPHDDHLSQSQDEEQIGEEHNQKVLELDVHIRPSNNIERTLSLFDTSETSDAMENGQGFLEKNLSDFFDIQIFSTVYFGSKKEPH